MTKPIYSETFESGSKFRVSDNDPSYIYRMEFKKRKIIDIRGPVDVKIYTDKNIFILMYSLSEVREKVYSGKWIIVSDSM